MSNVTSPPPRSIWRSSKAGGRDIVVGVVTGVIATVLISVFAAATSAFSKINAGNGAAFRVLLGMVFVGALAALATLAAAVFYGRKLTAASAGMATEARESKSAVLADIKSLGSSIARVDWSYDAAEHDAAFYERLRQVVENPRTMEFKAVTVFRDPRFQEVDDRQRDAIRGYYTALEIGTTAPGDRPGEPHHPVLGLLALENPDRHLADAFLLAYQSLRAGDSGDLGQVPRETVRDTVWARLDLCG